MAGISAPSTKDGDWSLLANQTSLIGELGASARPCLLGYF